MAITLGERIGAGGYRECFEVAGDPLVCAKLVRDHRHARVGLSIPKPVLRALERFGHPDVNVLEMKKHRQIPDALRLHCVPDMWFDKTDDGRRALIVPRVFNSDGSPTKTLREERLVQNEHFWNRFESLVGLMQEHDTQLFDSNPDNVLVQKMSDDVWNPVFVDVKRVGFKGGILKQVAGRGWNRNQRALRIRERFDELKAQYAA